MADNHPTQWPLRNVMEFACLPSAARWARKHTRDMLLRWNLSHLTDNAELLTSELITNAYKAAGVDVEAHGYTALIGVPPIQMRLASDRRRLLIEVWDPSPESPIAKEADQEAESGRGLFMVDYLAQKWNYYHPTTGGKIVWCELTDEQTSTRIHQG
ncbi:ATP-binding protein [Spirillospora sp. NBC_01491]|uniref:ATP-binding protein n=1 Tax=Spirillospora sp. NBC_01491 TaxID=2976007 RepID=UPI002E367C32|nr:ATP-binding protein [Spirillospora sp. NBC_01491]